jgi:hypothetical protein
VKARVWLIPDEYLATAPGAGTSKHLNGAVIPRDVPYAMRLRSDVPIIVQYSRLDRTQINMALMTTIAYPLRDSE